MGLHALIICLIALFIIDFICIKWVNHSKSLSDGFKRVSRVDMSIITVLIALAVYTPKGSLAQLTCLVVAAGFSLGFAYFFIRHGMKRGKNDNE